MTEVILRKRRGRDGEVGLFPVDDEGIELLFGLRDNRDVGCDVKQRRNPRHHRLFFVICRFVKDHCELFSEASTDEIKDSIKLATGLVKRRIDMDTGRTYLVLRSISWGAMDQTEFNQFFDHACQVISHRWMPEGTTADDVRDELIKLCDGEHAIPTGRPGR